MTSNPTLVALIRHRLGEIDKERDHLVALLQQYTNDGAAPVTTPKPATRVANRAPAFQARSGGPTERIIEVLRESPGLRYGEVVNRAMDEIDTTADNPRRSVGSTLTALVKRGKVRREDGRHYLAAP